MTGARPIARPTAPRTRPRPHTLASDVNQDVAWSEDSLPH
jgi:hypothetical protein